MKLSETGVTRPVATLMAFVAVFLLGVIAWQRLAIDMMPEIESPSISVFTRWDGASTEDVEQQITRVIESALGSVTDLDEIKHGLKLLTEHYGFTNYPLERCRGLEMLHVGKITINEITGKRNLPLS